MYKPNQSVINLFRSVGINDIFTDSYPKTGNNKYISSNNAPSSSYAKDSSSYLNAKPEDLIDIEQPTVHNQTYLTKEDGLSLPFANRNYSYVSPGSVDGYLSSNDGMSLPLNSRQSSDKHIDYSKYGPRSNTGLGGKLIIPNIGDTPVVNSIISGNTGRLVQSASDAGTLFSSKVSVKKTNIAKTRTMPVQKVNPSPIKRVGINSSKNINASNIMDLDKSLDGYGVEW
jgi:hypothetical protein